MLLLDDEPAIAFAVSEYFGACGYTVDTAASVHEAEALLARGTYEIVITDLSLDGRGGTEGLGVAVLVRRQHSSARVIILTAYGSRKSEAAAQRLGVDAFLHKPIPLRDLAQLLERLLDLPAGIG